MAVVGYVVLMAVLISYVVDVAVCKSVADRHRRGVPAWAWQAADVDRLFWGYLGTNSSIPFSDFYYLVRVRGRLDMAVDVVSPVSRDI